MRIRSFLIIVLTFVTIVFPQVNSNHINSITYIKRIDNILVNHDQDNYQYASILADSAIIIDSLEYEPYVKKIIILEKMKLSGIRLNVDHDIINTLSMAERCGINKPYIYYKRGISFLKLKDTINANDDFRRFDILISANPHKLQDLEFHFILDVYFHDRNSALKELKKYKNKKIINSTIYKYIKEILSNMNSLDDFVKWDYSPF
jgi:hypothetical protein